VVEGNYESIKVQGTRGLGPCTRTADATRYPSRDDMTQLAPSVFFP
ncbi:hypothetical protein A4A49_51399, partial [Nicotiana attenuata]